MHGSSSSAPSLSSMTAPRWRGPGFKNGLAQIRSILLLVRPFTTSGAKILSARRQAKNVMGAQPMQGRNRALTLRCLAEVSGDVVLGPALVGGYESVEVSTWSF